jgi:hypothetical protein
LIYCRSACTMALSLPNACVFPHSKLYFHMAYNPYTKERLQRESDELFATYPTKVRARLGRLTPESRMLGGAELISLGVPECGKTDPQVLIARATRTKPEAVASAAPMQGPKAQVVAASNPPQASKVPVSLAQKSAPQAKPVEPESVPAAMITAAKKVASAIFTPVLSLFR